MSKSLLHLFAAFAEERGLIREERVRPGTRRKGQGIAAGTPQARLHVYTAQTAEAMG